VLFIKDGRAEARTTNLIRKTKLRAAKQGLAKGGKELRFVGVRGLEKFLG
jgi:hypothetical protein